MWSDRFRSRIVMRSAGSIVFLLFLLGDNSFVAGGNIVILSV